MQQDGQEGRRGIGYVAEAAGCGAGARQPDVLPAHDVRDEVGEDPAVVQLHAGTVGMKGADDPDRDAVPMMPCCAQGLSHALRSEEHTSELQSLMRITYAVFCLKK